MKAGETMLKIQKVLELFCAHVNKIAARRVGCCWWIAIFCRLLAANPAYFCCQTSEQLWLVSV